MQVSLFQSGMRAQRDRLVTVDLGVCVVFTPSGRGPEDMMLAADCRRRVAMHQTCETDVLSRVDGTCDLPPPHPQCDLHMRTTHHRRHTYTYTRDFLHATRATGASLPRTPTSYAHPPATHTHQLIGHTHTPHARFMALQRGMWAGAVRRYAILPTSLNQLGQGGEPREFVIVIHSTKPVILNARPISASQVCNVQPARDLLTEPS